MDNRSRTILSRRDALLGLAETAALVGAGAAFASAGPVSAQGLAASPSSTAVTPFRVNVPQMAIDDLRLRLRMTRLPERETVGDWTQGVPIAKVQALTAYWRDHKTFGSLEIFKTDRHLTPNSVKMRTAAIESLSPESGLSRSPPRRASRPASQRG